MPVTAPNIKLRGIRAPMPGGFILGRSATAGSGDPQLLSIADLESFGVATKAGVAAAVAAGGGGGGGGGGTAALAAASASISGGVVTIERQSNIASITYTAVGRYRVNFTTPIANAQYGVAFAGRFPTEAGPVMPIIGVDSTSGDGFATGTLDIAVETAAGVIADLEYLNVLVYDPAATGGGGGTAGVPNLYSPPAASTFPTLIGANSPTLTTGALTSGLILNAGSPIGSDSWQSAYQPAPSGGVPFTLTARLKGLLLQTSGGYPGIGINMSDSSGRLVTMSTNSRGGTYGALQVDRWNSPTSFATEPYQQPMVMTEYFRVQNDGTNFIFFTSADGDAWTEFVSIPNNDWLTAGPTLLGFGIDVNTSGSPPTNWKYFVNCLYWKVSTP